MSADYAKRVFDAVRKCAIIKREKHEAPASVEVPLGVGYVYILTQEAEAMRPIFEALVKELPTASEWGPVPPLKDGPSYLALGALVGDQGTALCFMAVADHLGLATLVTPKTLGFQPEEPEFAQMAGAGLIMLTEKRKAGA